MEGIAGVTIPEIGIVGVLTLLLWEALKLIGKLVLSKDKKAEDKPCQIKDTDVRAIHDSKDISKRTEKHLEDTAKHLNTISLQIQHHVTDDNKFQAMLVQMNQGIFGKLDHIQSSVDRSRGGGNNAN